MALQVLIVEDEWVIAFSLRRLVESHGYEVAEVVSSGEAALEACPVRQPDVVLMDVQMPGMDGITATRRMMQVCPHPVIVVTGYAEYRDAAAQAGAMAYAMKPLQPEHVPELIETALQRFARFRLVHDGHTDCEEALADWVLVQRAVQWLAEREGVTEGETFARLQSLAAQEHRTLPEQARQLLPPAA